jgi:hypothetical protein
MTRIYLIVAGLVAGALGTMILLSPVAFYAGYGLLVDGQVDLLNELRSHGLGLLAAGLFIASAAFLSQLVTSATFLATALYLSYGTSRIVAMALDGLPSSGLQLAAGIEIVLGLVGLALLLRQRRVVAA